MTFNLIPIGAMQAGFIAEQWSAATAVIVGGIAVMIFAVIVQIFSKEVRNLGIALQRATQLRLRCRST